jgi:hypothetical protein
LRSSRSNARYKFFTFAFARSGTLLEGCAHAPCFVERDAAAFLYPAPFLMSLAAHLDDAGKVPLTDFCNRHSQKRAPDSIA